MYMYFYFSGKSLFKSEKKQVKLISIVYILIYPVYQVYEHFSTITKNIWWQILDSFYVLSLVIVYTYRTSWCGVAIFQILSSFMILLLGMVGPSSLKF